MAKQYTTDQLQAGDTFVVSGRTSYPRLTRVLEGAELEEEIKRATQQGRIPEAKPHSYTTLVDAQVEFANPQAPTLAELYAQERLYQNREGRICYSAVRKSPTLADYGVVDPQDHTKVNGIYLDPDKQVANDLFVKCYFRVYDTKAGMHKGVSLDTIVFQEPVKYYEFSNSAGQLANRGLTWTAPEGPAPQATAPVTPAYAPQAAAPVAPQMATPVAPVAPVAPAYAPQMSAPAAPQMTPPVAPQVPQMTAPVAPAYAPQMTPPVAPQAPQMNQPYAPQAPVAPQMQDPYAGNVPQQTIGNVGGSAFEGAYRG